MFSGGGDGGGAGGLRWHNAITRRPTLSIELLSPNLDGRVQTGRGQFSFNLDRLVDVADVDKLYWSGAPVTIYDNTNSQPIAQAPVEFTGFVARTSYDKETRTVTLALEVSSTGIDRPVLYTEFTGAGGINGAAEFRGTPFPAGFGFVQNVEPLWFDPTNNIGMIDGYANLLSVANLFEGGNQWAAKVADYPDYATLAARIADKSVPPGRWATCIAQGLIGLGAPPVKPITVDATFGTNRPGALIRRLLEVHAGIPVASVDTTAFAALDAAVNRAVHYWTAQQREVRDLVEAIAGSCNATPLVTLQGKYSVTRAFGGASAFSVNKQNPVSTPRVTGWRALDLDPPSWRMKMRAGRPGVVLNTDQLLYEDDLTDRGTWTITETYRQGDLVWRNGAQWLYINAVPGAGQTPPTPPTVADAHWERVVAPATAADLYYSNGSSIESLRPGEAGADVTETHAPMGAGNRISYSAFERGVTGWKARQNTTGGTPQVVTGLNNGRRFILAEGNFTGASQKISLSSDFQTALYRVPVRPAERLYIGAMPRINTLLNGGTWQLTVGYLDAFGVFINGSTTVIASGIGDLTPEAHREVFMYAPAGAYFAFLELTLTSAAAGAFNFSIYNPILSSAGPLQTTRPEWSPGPAPVTDTVQLFDGAALGTTSIVIDPSPPAIIYADSNHNIKQFELPKEIQLTASAGALINGSPQTSVIGQPSGVAPLDSNGNVPLEHLPDFVPITGLADPYVPADGTMNITGGITASGPIAGSNLQGLNTGDQFQQMGSARLLGRYSTGLGIVQEISLGSGLTLSTSGVLNAVAGTSSVTGITMVRVNATGTGASLAITLPANVAQDQMLVSFNGLEADPGDDYTVSANIVTVPAHKARKGYKVRIKYWQGSTGGGGGGTTGLSALANAAFGEMASAATATAGQVGGRTVSASMVFGELGSTALATNPGGSGTTAPVIDTPYASPNSSTEATVGFTTNKSGGTAFAVVSFTSNKPNGPQIADARDSTGATKPAANSPVTATGNERFTLAGLSAGIDYYVHLVQRDADGVTYSNVITSGILSMPAAGGTTLQTLAWSSGGSIPAGSAAGTTVGTVGNRAAGSTLTFPSATDFAVNSSTGVVTTAAANIAAGTYNVVIRETLSGATGSPKDTTLTITVTSGTGLQTLSWVGAGDVESGAGDGMFVDEIQGMTAGSTLSLVNNGGGYFQLSGASIYTVGTSRPAGTYNITVRETLTGATGSPKDTVLVVTVTGAGGGSPTLQTLNWTSGGSVAANAADGTYVGMLGPRTTNSAFSLVSNPNSLFRINSAGEVYTNGTGTNLTSGTHSITVRETLAGATNNPKDSVVSVAVGSGGGGGTTLQTLAWFETVNVAANAPDGSAAGSLANRTAGSTLTLADSAGGRFRLTGTSVYTNGDGSTLAAGTYNITVRETLSGATGSPKDTVLSIVVGSGGGGGSSLSALTWASGGSIPENSPAGTVVGTLGNRTSGSALSKFSSATNWALDSATGVVTTAVANVPAGSHSLTVTETLAGYTNSPRQTVMGITVTTSGGGTALQALNWASGGSIASTAASGSTVGTVGSRTSGSTLSIVSGNFAINSSTGVITTTSTFAAGSYSVTVRETLSGATGSPKDTVLTVTVTSGGGGGGSFSLLNAQMTPTSTATAIGKVETPHQDGWMYVVVNTSPTPPADTTIESTGNKHDVSAGSAEISQSFGGLTGGTLYYAHYFQRRLDGTGSNVLTASFTTLSSGTAAYIYNHTVVGHPTSDSWFTSADDGGTYSNKLTALSATAGSMIHEFNQEDPEAPNFNADSWTWTATFSDITSGSPMKFVVEKACGTEAYCRANIALPLAQAMGRMPAVMRQAMRRTTEGAIVVPNLNGTGILARADDEGHYFGISKFRVLTRATRGHLEEILMHEMAHCTLQRYSNQGGASGGVAGLKNSDGTIKQAWIDAVNADGGKGFTKRGVDGGHPEDFAESATIAYVLKYRPSRIPAAERTILQNQCPARISYFNTIWTAEGM